MMEVSQREKLVGYMGIFPEDFGSVEIGEKQLTAAGVYGWCTTWYPPEGFSLYHIATRSYQDGYRDSYYACANSETVKFIQAEFCPGVPRKPEKHSIVHAEDIPRTFLSAWQKFHANLMVCADRSAIAEEGSEQP